MSNGVKTYSVVIFNERYTLATDNHEQTLREAVQMVDSAMLDIAKQLCMTDVKKIAVLTALRYADQYIAINAEYDNNKKKVADLLYQIEHEIIQL